MEISNPCILPYLWLCKYIILKSSFMNCVCPFDKTAKYVSMIIGENLEWQVWSFHKASTVHCEIMSMDEVNILIFPSSFLMTNTSWLHDVNENRKSTEKEQSWRRRTSGSESEARPSSYKHHIYTIPVTKWSSSCLGEMQWTHTLLVTMHCLTIAHPPYKYYTHTGFTYMPPLHVYWLVNNVDRALHGEL